MERLIVQQKSVVPACDVATLPKLEGMVLAVRNVPGIEAIKVGLELVIPYGLAEVVATVRKNSSLRVIYDHQKGATDIPELGSKFARAVKFAGADAAILFPFGGAATEREWISACQREGLTVLVGGHMTQKEFLVSENGLLTILPQRESTLLPPKLA